MNAENAGFRAGDVYQALAASEKALTVAEIAKAAKISTEDVIPVSYTHLVETFEKATGVKLNWKYGPRRKGDIEKSWGDCTKANKVLGWKAEAKLEDVLASAWKWQQKLRADGIM